MVAVAGAAVSAVKDNRDLMPLYGSVFNELANQGFSIRMPCDGEQVVSVDQDSGHWAAYKSPNSLSFCLISERIGLGTGFSFFRNLRLSIDRL